jgi:hypothetical protein
MCQHWTPAYAGVTGVIVRNSKMNRLASLAMTGLGAVDISVKATVPMKKLDAKRQTHRNRLAAINHTLCGALKWDWLDASRQYNDPHPGPAP